MIKFSIRDLLWLTFTTALAVAVISNIIFARAKRRELRSAKAAYELEIQKVANPFSVVQRSSILAEQNDQSEKIERQPDVWNVQHSAVDASLRGLCVVDAKVVWSSGTGGTVIRTDDGGKSWQNVSVKAASELDFRDVQAFDDKKALVLSAGQPARIYKTVDGGATWKQVFEHDRKESFFDAMSFWDNQRGIAMSDPVDGNILLIETLDGGDTWKELPMSARPKAMRGEGGFAASGTNMTVFGDRCLIALGSAEKDQQEQTSRVIYSNDRGKTWGSASVPMARNQSSGIFSLAFARQTGQADRKIGIAIGGDYLKPDQTSSNIALTNDGGKTWRKPTGTVPRGFRSCVAYLGSVAGAQKLVAVGTNGTDISRDGGENWESASSQGFHAVAFTPDGKAGWATGSDGRVARWQGVEE